MLYVVVVVVVVLGVACRLRFFMNEEEFVCARPVKIYLSRAILVTNFDKKNRVYSSNPRHGMMLKKKKKKGKQNYHGYVVWNRTSQCGALHRALARALRARSLSTHGVRPKDTAQQQQAHHHFFLLLPIAMLSTGTPLTTTFFFSFFLCV